MPLPGQLSVQINSGQLLFRRALGGRWRIDDVLQGSLSLGRPGRLIGTVISEGAVALERFTPDV